jgi:hypothetical protein
VIMDGRRVNFCLTLAVAAVGADITTTEGLAKSNEPICSTLKGFFLIPGPPPSQVKFGRRLTFKLGSRITRPISFSRIAFLLRS